MSILWDCQHKTINFFGKERVPDPYISVIPTLLINNCHHVHVSTQGVCDVILLCAWCVAPMIIWSNIITIIWFCLIYRLYILTQNKTLSFGGKSATADSRFCLIRPRQCSTELGGPATSTVKAPTSFSLNKPRKFRVPVGLLTVLALQA